MIYKSRLKAGAVLLPLVLLFDTAGGAQQTGNNSTPQAPNCAEERSQMKSQADVLSKRNADLYDTMMRKPTDQSLVQRCVGSLMNPQLSVSLRVPDLSSILTTLVNRACSAMRNEVQRRVYDQLDYRTDVPGSGGAVGGGVDVRPGSSSGSPDAKTTVRDTGGQAGDAIWRNIR